MYLLNFYIFKAIVFMFIITLFVLVYPLLYFINNKKRRNSKNDCNSCHSTNCFIRNSNFNEIKENIKKELFVECEEKKHEK